MDEAKLLEKLKKIEALYAGATTDGEKRAAANARERVQSRLFDLQTSEEETRDDTPQEWRFTMANRWSRSLFLALLKRHEIKPYRYKRQRRTTVMARAPGWLVDEVIWPEFEELNSVLTQYLDDVAQRVIQEVLGSSDDEAEAVEKGELPG